MTFTCTVCKQSVQTPDNGFTTGYGLDRRNRKVCYPCCGERDKADMRRTGRATLYLTKKDKEHVLTNWPGTLNIEPYHVRIGHHNIARVRYDVWFTFESQEWHGVTYGDNTQLCHCRRKA